MNVAIAYVYPFVEMPKYTPLARRFAATWKRHPPGSEPFTLHVIANGGGPTSDQTDTFKDIPCQWLQHDNRGWDIGAFQKAAEKIRCDLLVCLGAPVHFHRSGWLDRMVDAYLNNGIGLYGCAAYLAPDWHVRTTAFWFPPELLQSYPHSISSSRTSRYQFEHGNISFTRHALAFGLPCIMVTWAGIYQFDQWQAHAPDKDQILVHDQHIHE